MTEDGHAFMSKDKSRNKLYLHSVGKLGECPEGLCIGMMKSL